MYIGSNGIAKAVQKLYLGVTGEYTAPGPETMSTVTATKYPAAYATSGNIRGTNYRNCIGKGSGNTASGNDYVGSSGSTATITYTFDFSGLPADVEIDNVSVLVGGHAESATYESGKKMCEVQLFAGDVAKSDAVHFTSTSKQVLTLAAGTWTRAELQNAQLRVTIAHYGGLVNGVDFVVSYHGMVPGPDITVNDTRARELKKLYRGVNGVARLVYEKKQSVLPYLTFSSNDSFTLLASGFIKHWEGTLEYSTDGGNTWAEWYGTVITAVQKDGTGKYLIFMRGTGNPYVTDSSSSWFINGGNVDCSGNIETLLDYNTVLNGEHPEMADGCYSYMFYECTSLTSAPALPATTLADNCYEGMFGGCTSLTSAPALPATTLADNCYEGMFGGCTNIKLSTTQTDVYQYAFRIPTNGDVTIEYLDPFDPLDNMFTGTGGTFTGTPSINTTYYTDHPLVV